MAYLDYLAKIESLPNILASIGSVILILFIRQILLKRVHSFKTTDNDSRRQWIVQIKNSSTLVILLILFLIWASTLQAFALSVVAIAAAIVIATKELLSCVLGGFLKFSTSMFKIGDRIEISGVRGDVINSNFLSTTLMEVGPGNLTHQYTGRKLIIPNSYLLTQHLYNDTRTEKFRLHTFTVKAPRPVDILPLHENLLAAAKEVCGQYESGALTYLKQVEKFEGIEAPSTDPRVHISLRDHLASEFIVRVPVPALKSAQIEQAILKEFIEKTPQLSATDKSEG